MPLSNRTFGSHCTWLLALLACGLSTPSTANAQIDLEDQTIIVSEFFDEIFRIDPGSNTAVDILDSDPFESPFGQLVEAVSPTQIIISDFNDLFSFTGSDSTTLVATVPGILREIVRDGTGNLVATSTSGLYSVDLTSGDSQQIFDATFFSPSDAVVSGDGIIYVTEFFESLNAINPVTGTRRQIGNFGADGFDHLDIGPDGLLYTVDGDEFHQVNPITGDSIFLGSAESAQIEDLKVDRDGRLLFGGGYNGIEGVFAFDPFTGGVVTLFDGATIDDTFFSVLDFTLAEEGLRTAISVPEPAALMPTIGLFTLILSRRHRSV